MCLPYFLFQSQLYIFLLVQMYHSKGLSSHQIVLYFLWQKQFSGQLLLGGRFPCSVCGDAYMTNSFNNHLKAIHEA